MCYGRSVLRVMAAEALPTPLAYRQVWFLARYITGGGYRPRSLAGARQVRQPGDDQRDDGGKEGVAFLEAESHVVGS